MRGLCCRGFRTGLIVLAWLLASTTLARSDGLEPQRRRFLAAESALKAGDVPRFRNLLSRLQGYPLLPYLQYRYYLDHPEDVKGVSGFLRQHDATRYARPVRVRLLKYLAAQKRWRDYLRFYRDVGDPDLRCHHGRALYELGNRKDAWREAQRLWRMGRSQPNACDPLFKAWRSAGRLRPQLVRQRFESALVNDKVRLAEYLVRLLPASERGRARDWLEGHRQPQRFLCRHGVEVLERDGRLSVHAIERLARIDLEAAIVLWQRLSVSARLAPKQRARGLRSIGLRLAWRHDPRAWQWLEQIPDALADSDVRTWRVRAALWIQDWSKVAEALARLEGNERLQGQWRYWQARTLAALHGEAAAHPLLEELAREADFYAFLAADRLGRAYVIDHRPVRVPSEVVARLAGSQTLRAIAEFSALNRYWDARREWWYLLTHTDTGQLPAAAILARRMGWPQMAIFALARAEQWDDLELRFPLRFLDQVRRYASDRGLAPAYVYGIIRQESAFDEHAASSAGARGLMQLMPFTARRVARQLQEHWHSARALLDADTNVRYGTTYFKSLLERFDGHFVLATAAYNAGPHRVRRWMPGVSLPADIWIETIPFRETRRYVRRVLAYAMIYQQRLGELGRRLESYAPPVPAVKVPQQAPSVGPVCVRPRREAV